MPSTLRDYQSEDLDTLRQTIRAGHKRVLFEASVGYGKSLIIETVAHAYAGRGDATLVLSNRTAVVDQLAGRAAGMDGVTTSTVQGIIRRLDRIPPPRVILIDEAHMGGAAAQYASVFDAFPDAVTIGFTGTPTPDLFGILPGHVQGCGARWLTDNGFLSPLRYHCPQTVDFSRVRTIAGDFDPTDLLAAVERSEICGDAIATYRDHCVGRPTLGFCISVRHAEMVRDEFAAAGFSSEILTGKDKRSEVARKIQHIRGGGLLLSISKVAAGFDLPDLHAIICLRPTKSAQMWVQMLGRPARVAEGKDFGFVFDHAGNTFRCGTLTETRNWRERGEVGDERQTASGERLNIRKCGCCDLAYEATEGVICPFCGHENGADLRISKRETVRIAEQEAADIEAAREAAAAERRHKGQSVKQRFGMLKAKKRGTTWQQAIESMRQSHAKAIREGDAHKAWQAANALKEIGLAA